MTLNQLQTYIVGVLKGWIPNKEVLDKFSETVDGKLLFNGMEVGSGGAGEIGEIVTDEQVMQAIADTLLALGLEISADASSIETLQTAIANKATKITLTQPISINDNVVLSATSPVTITSSIPDAFTVVYGGTLTLGNNITINATDAILYANGGVINIDGATLVAASPVNAVGFADNKGVINVKSGRVTQAMYDPVVLSTKGGEVIVSGDSYVGSAQSSVILAKNGGTVTIAGGTVEAKNPKMCAVYSKDNGIINMTSGKVINNANADNEGSYTLVAAKDGIVNMSGGSVDNGVLAHESTKAKATISGNAMVNGPIGNILGELVVEGGTFTHDPTEYLADGYAATKKGNMWVVGQNG